MLRKSLILLALIGCSYRSLTAQQTGAVDFPEIGIGFTVPSGWSGQVMGEAFIIGHQTQPGFVMLTTHDAQSVQEMRMTASQGLVDPANGIYLQPSGMLENIGNNGLGGTFSGSIGGQQTNAYLIGLLNPHGQGVMIMSAVSTQFWSSQYQQLAMDIAKSVRFSRPVAPPVAAQGGTLTEWKQRLGNTRLTYRESYNSIDYSNPDFTTGGGYSRKEIIDLCAQGYFNYQSSNSMSVTGGPGVSGSSSGNGRGAGSWDVREETNGNKILVLKFNSGEIFEYTLSYPENKMHLNGTRYYHTWGNDNGPACY